MDKSVAVTPQEAADQLNYADPSSIWLLLKKKCPDTGQFELASPQDQAAPSREAHQSGRLVTQKSIDDFMERHVRSPGGSWVHKRDNDKSLINQTARDPISLVQETLARNRERLEISDELRAEFAEQLEIAAAEKSELLGKVGELTMTVTRLQYENARLRSEARGREEADENLKKEVDNLAIQRDRDVLR